MKRSILKKAIVTLVATTAIGAAAAGSASASDSSGSGITKPVAAKIKVVIGDDGGQARCFGGIRW